MKNFLIRMIIIIVSAVLTNIGSMYAFLVDGIRTTIVEVRIPRTEEQSFEEYFGNILVHLCMTVYGLCGCVTLEIAMELLIGVISIAPKLVMLEFCKLDKKIEKYPFIEMQIRLMFSNIVQQIMDVDKYMISI